MEEGYQVKCGVTTLVTLDLWTALKCVDCLLHIIPNIIICPTYRYLSLAIFGGGSVRGSLVHQASEKASFDHGGRSARAGSVVGGFLFFIFLRVSGFGHTHED